MKRWLYLSVIIVAIVLIQLQAFADFAKITGNTVNVRSGPGLNYDVIQKINKSDKFTILGQQEEWIKIDLGNHKEGWVADWLADIEVDPAKIDGKKLRSKVKVLNVRTEPNTRSTIIEKITTNTSYSILGSKEDWIQIQLSQNKVGWVFSQYAEVISNETKDAPPQATIKIITTDTNLRSGPSTKHQIVAKAIEGETYPILESIDEWYKIQLKNGEIAYVAGWVVSVEGMPEAETKTTSDSLKGKVIVVDAGHGGKDQGSEGINKKTKEKEINLKVASLLAEKLESAGAKVIMTRKDDTFLSLQQRVDIAINQHADAFISVHHNTFKSSSMNGTISFYNSEKKDKKMADYIQAELINRNGLKDLGTRYGDYFVLRENPKPSVLVELGFLSNRNEEEVIRSKDFQEKSAEGIYQGIVKYFKNLNKN